MFTILIALFWAIVCPDQTTAHAHNNNNSSTVTTMDDTGGETGRIPPRPPRP